MGRISVRPARARYQAEGEAAFEPRSRWRPHARVAANVVGIVARELELSAAFPADASSRHDVTATLAEAVAARLAVANPRYFDN